MNSCTATNGAVRPVVLTSITQQPSQRNSTGQIDETSSTFGGLLVLFLFLIYIGIGIGYRKRRKKRAEARQEQIKTLERIWKMTPQREP